MQNCRVQFGFFVGFSIILNLNLAYACQPERLFPYVYELADGAHVWVMGAEMKDDFTGSRYEKEKEIEAFQYPHSGVYLKSRKDSPVWEWKGPFLKQDQVSDSLSPDGYYFFHIHDVYWGNRPYLSLYHAGKLFKQFDIQTFLDGPEQIVQVPCSSSIWARNWIYDENKNRLIVESFAKRVVEIDAESGIVVSEKPIMVKNISGRVHLHSGEHIQVSQIGKCKEPEQKNKKVMPRGMEIFQSIISSSRTQYIRDDDGFTDVPAFTIKVVEDIENPPGSNGNFQWVNYTTVRFDQVRKIDFESGSEPEKIMGRVELIDGSTIEWKIISGEWQFCAQRSGGDYIELTPKQLRELYIYRSNTGA